MLGVCGENAGTASGASVSEAADRNVVEPPSARPRSGLSGPLVQKKARQRPMEVCMEGLATDADYASGAESSPD